MGNPGLYIDWFPKDGGNRFSGTTFCDFTHEPWSASNYSDRLRHAASTMSLTVFRFRISTPGFGGPIRRIKLWFYAAFRYETLDVSVVDNYYDKNPAPVSLRAGPEPAGPRQRHISRTSRFG